MEEGVAWLAETFELGGINIEAGDYGVCGCDRCVARRANEAEASRRIDDYGDSWSHTDMADNFPRLYRTATAIKPDLWLYSEIQWDNLLDPVAHEAQRRLPRGGIYQHTTNRTYWGRIQRELTRDYVESLPTQPNVLRCQFACQWNGDERSERYALNARVFSDMARLCGQRGMQGLTVWGEPSPYHATVELSYLAFARFSWDPTLTWERFMAEDAAPLLGGVEAAERVRAHRRGARRQPGAAARAAPVAARGRHGSPRRRRGGPSLALAGGPDRPAHLHGRLTSRSGSHCGASRAATGAPPRAAR